MKQIATLFICLLSACLSFAQGGFSYVTTDVKEARRIADSIALTGPRKFKLEKTVNWDDAKELSFVYVSKELRKDYNMKIIKMYEEIGLMKNFKPDNVRMTIVFDIYKNADGSKKYRFSKVDDCKFEDLFPFWVNHIQPGANAKDIVDKRRSSVSLGENRPFTLVDKGGNWELSMGFD